MQSVGLKILAIILIASSFYLIYESFEKKHLTVGKEIIKEAYDEEVYAIVDGLGVEYRWFKERNIYGTSFQILLVIMSGLAMGIFLLIRTELVKILFSRLLTISQLFISVVLIFIIVLFINISINPMYGMLSVYSELEYSIICLLCIVPFGLLSKWLRRLTIPTDLKVFLFIMPFVFSSTIITALGFGAEAFPFARIETGPIDPNGIILFHVDQLSFDKYWWSTGYLIFRIQHFLLLFISLTIYLSAKALSRQ